MDTLRAGGVDSHVHIMTESDGAFFEAYRRRQGFEYINIVSTSCKRPRDITQNALALGVKHIYPRAFAHASLVYDAFPVRAGEDNARDFSFQAEYYNAAGFDGIKILESKPTLFKETRLKLSDDTYDLFFGALEARGTHIVWHACDPAPFWDKAQAPAFAREAGWFYGDGTYETFENLQRDVLSVLDKHPKLNATLAHFFFLSDNLELAEDILNKYPRVCLDITPGREMYDNFTQNYERAREFFHKYYARLHFGTDMTSTEFQGDQDSLVSAMRRFLATEDKFEYWGFDMRGIGLPAYKLSAIAGENFKRDAGETPREVNTDILMDMQNKAKEITNQTTKRAQPKTP